jgi:hypothetical protein
MPKRNWRRDTDYEFTKDLDLNGWAWEFLRRNPEYRNDWEIELQNLYQTTPPHKIDIEDDCFSLEPDKNDCKTKWWIARFVNPETDYPIGLDFVNSYGRIYHESTKIDLSPGRVAVIFDLNLPIKRQVKLTASRLRQWQGIYEHRGICKRRKPKTNNDLWKSYLRVLDAKTDGAANKDIDDIVFQGQRENIYDDNYHNTVIRDALKSATKLVEGGYCDIISGP